jgi:hypothetical protein
LTVGDKGEFSLHKEVVLGFEHVNNSKKFLFMRSGIVALGGIENTRVKDCRF